MLLIKPTPLGEGAARPVLDALEQLAALHALHDDQQAAVGALHVLVHGVDVDDVRTGRGPPVDVHLAAGLGVVA